MNADDTKRCAKCWRYLPLGEFKRDARTQDRLSYRCLDCLNLQKRNGHSQLVRQAPVNTIVPKAEQSSSETTRKASNQNDHAETITTTPHPHGEH